MMIETLILLKYMIISFYYMFFSLKSDKSTLLFLATSLI